MFGNDRDLQRAGDSGKIRIEEIAIPERQERESTMAKENRIAERIVTVFGSSRPAQGDADYQEAFELGKELGARGLAVCSGGYGGVMEAVSRGVKEAGGKTYGVTADFFAPQANKWIDVEVRMKTWEERLFELIRLGNGFVACKGGTGTLVELAVVWEMLNKSVMEERPFAVLGDFWQPILDRVREVEQGPRPSTEAPRWAEAGGRLAQSFRSPQDAANYLAEKLLVKHLRNDKAGN
jgi:uncharacterized protein (TIGR00725 family)